MSNIRPTKSAAHETTRRPALRSATMADDFRRLMHQGLRRLPHDSTVLAIGCEQAFLAAQLAEYGTYVTVLDTSASQIGQLAPRFPEISFVPINLAQPLPLPSGSFDAIWCCEFLDRVFDPASALREMHRVLRPGGELHLAVPDQGRLRQVLGTLFRRDHSLVPATPRIRNFTRGTLQRMARQAGFADIKLTAAVSVRRLTGGLVPRPLMLSARKAGVAPVARRLSATGSRSAVLPRLRG